MGASKRECACGRPERAYPCATCGRKVCPECRTATLVHHKPYIECKPCRRERGEWNRELRADKNFMRWHGFRRYIPVEEYKERTSDDVH